MRGKVPAAALAGLLGLAVTALLPSALIAQGAPPPPVDQPQSHELQKAREAVTITCASKLGERNHCPANTTKGVALLRSSGQASCLLGKTWGYDDDGVWVSDGCTGEFVVGEELSQAVEKVATKQRAPRYVPNAGFLLFDGDNGQIYMRLFSYARYLNQESLEPSYTDFFGNEHNVQLREDIQLVKFFLPFSGWFLDPRLRYYLYVWSANTSQGDPAQVVGAGNLSWTFNRFVTFGAGITSLPSTRSTEGQFPYWLGVDDRLTSDEFFRGSYTSGAWIKGELTTKLKYMVMLGNNLSTLGVSATQIDNGLNTMSYMLQWLPTTGEFGLYGTFGDYDWHEKPATRLAGHYTKSHENQQSQPGTDSIENSQIRLTDGSVIFTPDLFGVGINVTDVLYEMASLDGGFKYKGFSVEAEYFRRRLSDYRGPGTDLLEPITDDGYQVQASAMVIKNALQLYAGGAEINGDFGDSTEIRAGANWYPLKKRGFRLNAEWIRLNNCPVGYAAVPYPVGGDGDVYHVNMEMNF
ncbi:MAG TPA: DUF3011 domain-containing protein [Verrucomicrobiae bacterium]|nr:DUF3011 domain-containing protein [Verrucomicrobiae bacterium]